MYTCASGEGHAHTQARFPKGMYTCVSGFVEHAESVESAAAREVAEETAAWSKCPLGSARARLLQLLRARLAALGGSALPG